MLEEIIELDGVFMYIILIVPVVVDDYLLLSAVLWPYARLRRLRASNPQRRYILLDPKVKKDDNPTII